MYKFFCGHIFLSFLGISRSGYTGSYGNSMINLLKNCQTVFPSSYTILHSHQLCIRVLITISPHQHFLLSGFFIIAIAMDVKCPSTPGHDREIKTYIHWKTCTWMFIEASLFVSAKKKFKEHQLWDNLKWCNSHIIGRSEIGTKVRREKCFKK